jgi:hypothetical protein
MMLAIFPILMSTVSFAFRKTMIMTVHNYCTDIELISPVYFHNCETRYEYPVGSMDDGTVMKTGFRFDPDQDEPRGILMCKVQGIRTERFDHQSSIDTIYTKVIEETSKRMQLLVAWKVEYFRWPKLRVMLVEYDNEPVLDEDKLARLYDKVNSISFEYPVSHAWLMYDNTSLNIACEVMRKEDLELKITIFRGFGPWITRPMWIDSTRQVSSEMAMCLY